LRPLEDLKSADARPSWHKLYPALAAGAGFTIFYLYQIIYLPVKENLPNYACYFNSALSFRTHSAEFTLSAAEWAQGRL